MTAQTASTASAEQARARAAGEGGRAGAAGQRGVVRDGAVAVLVAADEETVGAAFELAAGEPEGVVVAGEHGDVGGGLCRGARRPGSRAVCGPAGAAPPSAVGRGAAAGVEDQRDRGGAVERGAEGHRRTDVEVAGQRADEQPTHRVRHQDQPPGPGVGHLRVQVA
ncbi:MAG: hypothetical protein ACRDRH_21500 [Pseudonocardia sp.]